MEKDKTQITIETYDNIVPEFLEYFNYGKNEVQFKEQLDFLAGLLPPKSKILDAGCGLGFQSKYLNELGFDVIGIDAAPNMVEQSRKLTSNCEFRVMDVRNLNFMENSFDCIICFAVLIHLNDSDCKQTLNKFYKMLKPNGILLVNVKEHFDDEAKEIFDKEPLNPKFKTYFNGYKKEFMQDYLIKKLNMHFLKEFNSGLFNPDAIKNGTIKKNLNQFTIVVKKF